MAVINDQLCCSVVVAISEPDTPFKDQRALVPKGERIIFKTIRLSLSKTVMSVCLVFWCN